MHLRRLKDRLELHLPFADPSEPDEHQAVVDAAGLVARVAADAFEVCRLGVLRVAGQLVAEPEVAVRLRRLLARPHVPLPDLDGVGVLPLPRVDDAQAVH
jgi:hypothetical protein